MKIRPKNSILYAATGVRFSSANAGGANWRQQVFNNYRQHLLDQLSKYGEADDYGQWLNEMQHRHSQLWNAANQSGNWENIAYENENVGKYQQDYRGGKGNDGNYQRFGTIQLNPEDRYDFNQTGIKTNQSTRYNIPDPPKRISGDFSRKGYDYRIDNYYSGITDDRRLLGRKGDWDENSQEYKDWIKQLNERGWTMYFDDSDQYYKLKRLGTPNSIQQNNNIQQNPQQKDPNKTGGSVEEQHNKYGGFDWNKINEGLKRMFPGLLGAGRLAGTLISNNRIYDEALKGIRPNLMQSYHTHRQVVGDEATKQAYYRRAAQGQTRSAQPFTADADRQIAYQNEAKRIGDELRAQGDLADNAEIRRTSDESNQHQWANTQRDTEIANTNIASINQANALRQNLLAQKHASDWSSINNYLLEKETRARQASAEEQAIQDQLWLLQEQQNLANDNTYADLYKKAAKDVNDGLTTSENIRAFNNYKTQLEINRLKNRPRRNSGFFLFAKKGTALEYKKKDDLLYKTARDVVEHFRKMSKYSSDSYNRRPIKIEKLTPHPKGNTRRYQQGGMAPFVVYTPAPMGGETTTSSQASTSGSGNGSGKGSGKDESLELVKSLFKEIGGNGLPIDVNLVYDNIQKLFNQSKILGTEMTSSDIASVYLQAMQQLSNIKYSQDSFNKLEQLAASNEALNEFAVTADGQYVVSDKDGIISYEKSLEKIIKEGKNPITNQQLLNMRAYSPHLAFQRGDYIIDNVIANGMGINKIGAQIKALAGNLGSTEGKLEGISQVESGKVRAGLQILSGTQGTPDGYYSITNIEKDQKGQIKAAVDYISNMLSPSQKAILQAHGGVEQNILSFLTSQENYTREQTISPLTGKASNKDKEGDLDKLGINSAVQLLLGMSSPREFTFSIGNGNTFNGMARVSSITKDGNSMGADFTYSDVYKSDLHKNLDLDNASFGDVPINKALKDRIIIDNSTIAGVDLPYTTDRNGRIIPDFKMLNRIEEADQEILRAGINPEEEPQKVNEIYTKHNLPIKYGADNRLTGNYKRFAVIQATAIEDVFLDKSGLASNGTLSLVSDEEEIDKYINEIKKTTGQKEIDRDRPGLFTGDKDIYKGSIFIPIIGDLVDAVSATGGLKAGNYDELRSKYQTKNYNEAPQFVKQ